MVINDMTNCEHRLSSNGVKGCCSSRQPCMRAIAAMYTKRCRQMNFVALFTSCMQVSSNKHVSNFLYAYFALTVHNRANDKYDHMLPGLQKGKSAGEFLI
jgi:hypothetical protein